MASILACTDGSLYAPSVYDHTAWAAKRLKARVHVLHMLNLHHGTPPMTDLSGSIGIDAEYNLREALVAADEARGRVAQEKAKAILADARHRLQEAGVTDVEADAKHGALVESIEDYEAEAALVVIGKRGESADFAKMHLGANLERVIRSVHHPVLVTSRAFKPIERMLIAFDGGPSALKAVEYAATQPLLRDIHCTLLSVGKPNQSIESDLAAAAERMTEAGYTVEAHRENGHAEEVIAQAVKDRSIDLLVMGAYGHSRVRQLIVGSTTTTMVRTCLVPVLMFR